MKPSMSEETPLLVSDSSAEDTLKETKSKKGVTFSADTKSNTRYPKRQQSEHNRYQSSVTHLPTHISSASSNDTFTSIHPQTASGPLPILTTSASALTIIDDEELPPTKLDPSTQKQQPYIPNIQLCLLWFNVSIFTIAFAFCLVAILMEYNIISTAPIMIAVCIIVFIVSISGLIMTYSYRNIIFNVLELNTKLYDYIMQTKLQQINSVEDIKSDDGTAEVETIQAVSLLAAFRRGDFHTQLEVCSSEDLKQLLPVVLSCRSLVFYSCSNILTVFVYVFCF